MEFKVIISPRAIQDIGQIVRCISFYIFTSNPLRPLRETFCRIFAHALSGS